MLISGATVLAHNNARKLIRSDSGGRDFFETDDPADEDDWVRLTKKRQRG